MLQTPRRARIFVAAAMLAAGLAALLPRAESEPTDPIAGAWSVAGSNSNGPYAGAAQVEKLQDGSYAIKIKYKLTSGEVNRLFVGKLDGKNLTGERGKNGGFVSSLAGKPKVKDGVKVTYVLSADGQRLDGRISATWRETLSRAAAPSTGLVLVDANRDGKVDAADANAMKTQAALGVFVRNRPDAVKSPIRLDAPKPVKLVVTGAGQGRIVDANGKDVTTALPKGVHDLGLVATAEGDVDVVVQDATSSDVLGRARISLKAEKLYLVMFGYEGAEVDYLESDAAKVRSKLLPKLIQAGYKLIEDGSSYDQNVLAKGLADWNVANKIVFDWCVTHEDWTKYLERGTTKGLFWGSHGFMEPFIGCPDEDLLKFESRVWTSPPGQPETTESKHFVREWKKFLDSQPSLDFAIMHSCCTGSLGAYYAPKAWDYCDSGTKSRVQAKFGSLPPAEQLDQSRSFNWIRANVTGLLQTYDGPSYFGLSDVSWSQAIASMKP